MAMLTTSLALLVLLSEPQLEQITPGGREPVSAASQISGREEASVSPPLIQQTGARNGETASAEQVTRSRGDSRASEQLAPEGDKAAEKTAQLHSADKTAEPPTALSKRTEGRTAKVVEVKGKDRCDEPDLPDDLRDYCAHVIETRAEEFVRPDPLELTEEQKLTTEQPQLTGKKSIDTVSRRLSEDAEPSDIAEQGVAAVVYDSTLNRIEDQQPDTPHEPFSGQSVLIESVVTAQPGH
jgi:hypothetical protein